MNSQGIKFNEQLAVSALGMTVNSFVKAANEDPSELTLRPAFQRNLVWNNVQRSYLVDSILRGFPVPEVYIQKRTDAEGGEETVVVDGQQRIETCLRFVRDDLVLVEPEEARILDERWKGKKFSQLDRDLKSRFRSFEFVTRQLPTSLNEAALREIFRRMNQTVESLEPQELRHAAYTGEFIQLVEAISSSRGLAELGVFTPKDILRRRSDEFVSEILYSHLLGELPNKKEGLDAQYMIYERVGFPLEARDDLIWRWRRVEDFMVRNGGVLKRTRFKNKSDAYSLIIFLLRNADRLPLGDGSNDSVLELLKKFSEYVSKMKRMQNEEGGAESDIVALVPETVREIVASYLRGVERAASDRGSRVRRDQSLNALLEPLFRSEVVKPPTPEDRQWLRTDGAEDELDDTNDDDPDAEWQELQRVLIEEA